MSQSLAKDDGSVDHRARAIVAIIKDSKAMSRREAWTDEPSENPGDIEEAKSWESEPSLPGASTEEDSCSSPTDLPAANSSGKNRIASNTAAANNERIPIEDGRGRLPIAPIWAKLMDHVGEHSNLEASKNSNHHVSYM